VGSLVLLGVLASAPSKELDWKDATAVIDGKTIHYQVLASETPWIHRGLLTAQLGAETENTVYIGIDVYGHVYVVAGRRRYDPGFFDEEPNFNAHSDLLDEGIIIAISDEKSVIKNDIIKFLDEHGPPRSLDCTSGACKLFNEATDLKLNHQSLSALLPHTLVEKLLGGELSTINGAKVSTKLMVVGPSSLENAIGAVRYREKRELLHLGFRFFGAVSKPKEATQCLIDMVTPGR
jgi:hypothetical protein